MDLTGLHSVTTASQMIDWLAANCKTPISPAMTGSDFGVIMEKILSLAGGPGGGIGTVTSVGSATPDIEVANGSGNALISLASLNGYPKSYYDPSRSIQQQLNEKISLDVLTATSPLNFDGDGGFTIDVADETTDGYLSAQDYSEFKQKVSFNDLSAEGALVYDGTGVFYMPPADSSTDGYLSSSDYYTFSQKADINSFTANGPLSLDGAGTFSIDAASSNTDGYLASSDYTIFSQKPDLGSFNANSPLNYDGNGTFSITAATSSTDGYLSSSDYNTFNQKPDLGSFTANGPLTYDGNGTFSIAAASYNNDGYLTSSDYYTFNQKPDLGSFTANGPLNYDGSGTFSIAAANYNTDGYLTSSDYTTFSQKPDLSSFTAYGPLNYDGNGTFSIVAANYNTDGYLASSDYTTFSQKPDLSSFTAYGPLSYDGNGTFSIAAANYNTDGYLASSDYTTFSQKPDLSSFTAYGPLSYDGNGTFSIAAANYSTDGYLSAADYNLFTNKAELGSFNAAGPLSYDGNGGFSIMQVNSAQDGYLSSADYLLFNSKANLGDLTAAGPITYDGNGGFSITQASTVQDGYLSAADYTTLTSKAALGDLTAADPLVYDGAGGFSIQPASETQSGYLTAADYATLTAKPDLSSFSAVGPVVYDGAGQFSLTAAGVTADGYLTSGDWEIFKGKQDAITVTNIGESGAATLAGNVLNIPAYTLEGLGGAVKSLTAGSADLTISGDAVNPVLTLAAVNGRSLSYYDVNSSIQTQLDGKLAINAINAAGPLAYTAGNLSITKASASADGYLSALDWNAFNRKLDAAQTTLPASFVNSSLVSAAGGTFGANAFNSTAFLTSNQPITLTGDVTGTGTTSIAVNLANVGSAGTYSQVTVDAKGRVTAGTAVLPVAGGGTGATTLTGLLKGNGTAALSTAVAGTDYQTPLTFSSGLAGTTAITNTLITGLAGGQKVIGGTAATNTLSLQGTTANGTASSAAIKFLTGNNGAKQAATILNNGNFGIGATAPVVPLQVQSSNIATEQFRIAYDGSNYTSFFVNSAGDLRISNNGAVAGNIVFACSALFQYGLFMDDTTELGNLNIPGGIYAGIVDNTRSSLLFNNLTKVTARITENGFDDFEPLSVGGAYVGHLIGKQGTTVAASGTHPRFTALAVQPPYALGTGSSITVASTVCIPAAPTSGINNYALEIISGDTLLGGALLLNGSTSGQISIRTAAVAGTFNFNMPTSAGSAGQVLTSQGGGANPMTWSSIGLNWSEVTAASKTMSAGQGYIATSVGNSQLIFTLPATASVGQVFAVTGAGSGGWKIAQNAGQSIKQSSSGTTAGTGSLVSGSQYDAVELVCVVANTTFAIRSVQGTLTFN